MKFRNKVFIFFAICLLVITGCSAQNGNTGSSSTGEISEETVSNSSVEKSENDSKEVSEITPEKVSETDSKEVSADDKNLSSLNIVALKGPTGMGLAPLADKTGKSEKPAYSFSFLGAPDEVSPLLIKGDADIAAIPANLAAVLNKKTDGDIKILAINTLGVLSIVERGDSVKSIPDLSGKTIYASGKGATPEYILNYLLEKYGISEDDVTIEWKSEHSECLSALTETDDAVAMLPQPFITAAQNKIKDLNIALDLTDEWDNIQLLESDNNRSALITGVVVARKEVIEKHPEEINKFMEEYKQSVEFANNNIDETSNMIGELEIFDSNIAKAALPKCHIVYIDGEEMINKLMGFYQVLFDQNPSSIGGEMPTSDLFYLK